MTGREKTLWPSTAKAPNEDVGERIAGTDDAWNSSFTSGCVATDVT